jgi:hypothetical protein
MKMNVTRNAYKHKQIFLFRDLSFAVNFNLRLKIWKQKLKKKQIL